MTEEIAEASQETETHETQEAQKVDDQHVPYERFKTTYDRAQVLESEAKDLRRRLEEREQADLSEQEKLARRAEQAELRAQELETRTTQMERSAWIRDAAQKHDFQDPGDAVALSAGAAISDEREAERAVRDLAKAKPHLIKPQEAAAPTVGRVLSNGRPAAGDSRLSAAAQVKEMEGNAVLDAINAAHGKS